MRFVAFLSVAGLMLASSLPVAGAPDVVTCERGDRIKQAASLETPRGAATGMVCLDDGDSFSIGTTWVRLDGLDAPSNGRFCNRDTNFGKPRCKTSMIALDALADLIANGVVCKATKFDGRKRWLATCTLPDGRDLGEQLVRQGFACAATRYSDKYSATQNLARGEVLGYWAKDSGVDLAKQCAEQFARRKIRQRR